MNLCVLGAGAWGTALAKLLHQGGHAITLWSFEAVDADTITRTGVNERYLPGVKLPMGWRLETDVGRALEGNEGVVVAVPSKAFRSVTRVLSDYRGILVTVTKGIEHDTGLSMSSVLRQNAPHARIAALSGPSLALEVAKGIPTAVVAASEEESLAHTVQQLFHRPAFRVYTSTDVLGVELGGALKNVVAIAAGVGDGLGFGDNSKAALVTRGIAEVRRLGVACGARAETFAGLSGLGDLTVTCFSRLSRNRGLGERLGRGESLQAIQAKTVSVAEGVPTAQSARQLARKLGVTTPIIDQVHALLFEGKPPGRALQDLTGREPKAED